MQRSLTFCGPILRFRHAIAGHGHALTQFQLQLGRRYAGIAQDSGEVMQELLVAELLRGAVDGNPAKRETLVDPEACLPAGFTQYPSGDGRAGCQRPRPRMLPAQQRFQTMSPLRMS
ncbi:hypothetical protein CTP10_R00110 [Cupriavidus sp. P-10]|uniref:hypothetical protein n=1 Tax=Cupriavidus sp. P-10 TaxID=2027911 RepID=UPI001F3503CE|nr:hypothetical protein [Cupriavidus sp. P-10]BDB22685.1 hypothetical protein CTP10_R00110 [Cupriavidus sp. P-10]